MLAVVTGATGLLGGNLALTLLEQGHTVRATKRRSSRVAHLGDAAIEWVDGDVGDAASLERAFQGADVVFHCAAAVSVVRKVTPALRATNVDGTRHVLDAARKAGVRRVVHCSTVAAVGLGEHGPGDETTRWNFAEHGMDDGYTTTKHEAEAVVREAVAAGQDVVVVNPTYMLGPYDARPSSGKILIEVMKRSIPGHPGGANNFVDVRDVARGMILAAAKGRTGERYILSGHNLPYRELFLQVAQVAGTRPIDRPLPRWLAEMLGLGGDVLEAMGKEPFITSTTVRWGWCRTFQFTCAKAQAELGYAPGPLAPAIADAIAWFRQHGMV